MRGVDAERHVVDEGRVDAHAGLQQPQLLELLALFERRRRQLDEAGERALGESATRRLIALLNAGPFTLERQGSRDADRYGRLLRTVTRGGQSLGERLVAEGLAEPWRGHRGDWCILR